MCARGIFEFIKIVLCYLHYATFNDKIRAHVSIGIIKALKSTKTCIK